MKKNISINLQGVIFYIEEDAYEILSTYLAAVKNHFTSYEGHVEITADIEARIAELFMAKLSPVKQVITQEDVQALIAQMGSVADFEDMADEMADLPPSGTGATQAGSHTHQQQPSGSYTHQQTPETKRLYRDGSRKMLGGVAAGIANYLAMDPLWIRIAFVFLVIGLPFTGGISGFGILAYIILWIALPETHLLPETPVKKLYRDPDDKKLGGVCSGLGLYFGADPSIIRILFLVLFLVFGIGLMLYILLWILVPEATTLTEKMQMQGNPVTLSGIENSLKKNLNLKDENGHETTVTRLLLFPIRLLSQIIEWLALNLKPLLLFLVALIRIFTGVMLLIIATVMLAGLFVVLLTATGLYIDESVVQIDDIPASVLFGDLPVAGVIAGFVAGLIPALLLFVLGIGLLAKRFYMRATVGWSLFAIWLLSLFVLISSIAMYQKNFRRTGEYSRQTIVAAGPYQTVVLDASETGLNRDNDLTFDLDGHTGPDITIREVYRAKGRSEEDARQNARMLTYRVQHQDSSIVFDDAREFMPNSVYRMQKLTVVLRLPESKKYRITRSMARLLPSSVFDHTYSYAEIAGNEWQVRNNLFTCLSCSATDTTIYTSSVSDTGTRPEDTPPAVLLREPGSYGSGIKSFRYSGFDKVEAGNNLHIRILEGRDYSITARGSKRQLKKLDIDKDGRTLSLEMDHSIMDMGRRKKPVLVEITMPDLKAASLSGAAVAEISGFDPSVFSFESSGAARSDVRVKAREIRADVSGASHTTFAGHTDRFIADGSGASKINASQLQARNVTIEVSGAGNATVFASESLTAEATGASKIFYYGNPGKTSFGSSSASRISKK